MSGDSKQYGIETDAMTLTRFVITQQRKARYAFVFTLVNSHISSGAGRHRGVDHFDERHLHGGKGDLIGGAQSGPGAATWHSGRDECAGERALVVCG